MHILLDMDGVLVDFVGGICRALHKLNPYTQPESAGVWECDRLLGMHEDAFYAPCHDVDFWTELDWMPDGDDILAACYREVGAENVFLLSTPTLSANSFKGKALWVKRNCPEMLPRLMLSRHKHLCAKDGAVLVDDSDRNVDAFYEAGGMSVLVPRPWNRRHAMSGNALFQVERGLKCMEIREACHA